MYVLYTYNKKMVGRQRGVPSPKILMLIDMIDLKQKIATSLEVEDKACTKSHQHDIEEAEEYYLKEPSIWSALQSVWLKVVAQIVVHFIVSLIAKLQMRTTAMRWSANKVQSVQSCLHMFTFWIESSSSGRCRVIGPPWPRVAVANVHQ